MARWSVQHGAERRRKQNTEKEGARYHVTAAALSAAWRGGSGLDQEKAVPFRRYRGLNGELTHAPNFTDGVAYASTIFFFNSVPAVSTYIVSLKFELRLQADQC